MTEVLAAPSFSLPATVSFEVFQSKLRPPPGRVGAVARPALLQRLDAARDARVISVAAPPGYGKTSLLAQWMQGNDAPVAWVSVDERDNDPAVLLTYAAAAFSTIEPIDPQVFRTLEFPGLSIAADAVPRLAHAAATMTTPPTLVLDHIELLRNQECRDALREFAGRLPDGAQLVLAARDQPPLPMSRLRARGEVVEFGALDLAMDFDEAVALFRGVGVDFADDEVSQLVLDTEGWPTGLYLAALARAAGGTTSAGGMGFSGDERGMSDYLRSELLDRLPERTVRFLTRTSMLEQLNGSICDAVLDTTGSAEVLESLEQANVLVRPVDHRREWYRYHRLFRDLLRTELRRREPETARELHLRAARWCDKNQLAEQALEHAREGEDVEHTARLLTTLAQPTYASGRLGTVRAWVDWMEPQPDLERYPALAAISSMLFALVGQPGRAEHWGGVTERAEPGQRFDDGSVVEGWQAAVRLFSYPRGPEQLRHDAETCLDQLAAGTGMRATATFMLGYATLLEGDATLADAEFAYAVEVSTAADAAPTAGLALTERALLAADREEWRDAAELVGRALTCIREGAVEGYCTSALTYATLARVALHRGDVTSAELHAHQAARLRPLLTSAFPHISVQTLTQIAGAYVSLLDPEGARAAMRQAADIARQRPNLGVLRTQLDDLRARIELLGNGTVGPTALSSAELRLVPFLATYLTLAEIAERRYLSPNTIKTHVSSIYRKLGVSNRREAVELCMEVGLIT